MHGSSLSFGELVVWLAVSCGSIPLDAERLPVLRTRGMHHYARHCLLDKLHIK